MIEIKTYIDGKFYKLGRQMYPDMILPYPVSNNCYYRRVGNLTLISAAGRKFKAIVKSTYFNRNPTTNYVGVLVYYHTRLTAKGVPVATQPLDWDNVPKSVCDSLIGIGYVDDKQIKYGTVIFGEPVKKGATTVKIFELVEVNNDNTI